MNLLIQSCKVIKLQTVKKLTSIRTLVLLIACLTTGFLYSKSKTNNIKTTVTAVSNEWQTGFSNLPKFKYMINQKSCSEMDTKLDLLVMTDSNPQWILKRQAIRQTWGNYTASERFGKFRLFFTMGHVQDPFLQDRIIEENKMYHDIIQGSYIDSYYNHTYDHLMKLKWYTEYCPNVKFLLKTDDDIFVNMPRVLESLKKDYWQKLAKGNPEYLLCTKLTNGKVYRDINHKWYVPRDEVEVDIYPPYCSGDVIFYPKASALRLFETANKMHYVRLDDVFITGTARVKTNVTIHDFGNWRKTKAYLDDELKKNDPDLNFFIGPFWVKPEYNKLLWKSLIKI